MIARLRAAGAAKASARHRRVRTRHGFSLGVRCRRQRQRGLTALRWNPLRNGFGRRRSCAALRLTGAPWYRRWPRPSANGPAARRRSLQRSLWRHRRAQAGVGLRERCRHEPPALGLIDSRPAGTAGRYAMMVAQRRHSPTVDRFRPDPCRKFAARSRPGRGVSAIRGPSVRRSGRGIGPSRSWPQSETASAIPDIGSALPAQPGALARADERQPLGGSWTEASWFVFGESQGFSLLAFRSGSLPCFLPVPFLLFVFAQMS